MATEKITPMVLKVDLQCPSCYKKIRKTLCKIPQIRDQVFDEKNNAVYIVVVCCSPEKIRDKLCYKGGKVIKSIEIKDAAKPKEPEKKESPVQPKAPGKPKDAGDKPKVVVIEKPKDPEKPKVTIIEPPAEKPKAADKPKANGKADKPKADGAPAANKPKADGAPPADKPKEAPKMEPAKIPEPAAKPVPLDAGKMLEPVPASGVPSVFPYIGPAYDPYGAGPYYHGYGFPPPPPPQPCYEGYYGYGTGHAYGSAPGYGTGQAYGSAPGYGYGYSRVGQVNRSDGYFSEENPQGCSIM